MPAAGNRRLAVGMALLAAAMLLAVAKPAVHLLLNPQGPARFGLHVDYGVPTSWYGQPGIESPAGVKLPADSIGLDFLNIDSYLRCAGLGSKMYRSHCTGDPTGRPFAYPPLLAAAFFWVVWVSTPAAVALWALAVLFLIGANTFVWGLLPAGKERPAPLSRALIAAFLLMVSYPAVFAFERGNTEVLVLTALTLAAGSLVLRNWFLLGFLTAIAAVAKLYPWFTWASCFALAAALLLSRGNRKPGVLILAGSLLGFFLPLAAMLPQHVFFFREVLPYLSRVLPFKPNCFYCHSWPAAYHAWGYGTALVLGGLALAHFAVFARRYALHRRPADLVRALVGFAYGMAVSVNVPNTSYDYSLIMLFPLFMICMLWDGRRAFDLRGIGFIVLLCGTTLPRWLEGLAWKQDKYSAFLMLETAGMALIGLSLARELLASKQKGVS